MIPEYNEIFDLDDIGGVLRVVILDELEDLKLNESLVKEFLLAADDL
jgi:hypothetical protein